ncbi:aquaporin-like protein [Venturia nashicola]|uniref:Aquaporin-like protein n=1 Tax=Venturia nashicola TaxID=86259 RepID=A0A4Z1PG37_9PEZI|nr:aquaporin-like protein [Venturia nashicola]
MSHHESSDSHEMPNMHMQQAPGMAMTDALRKHLTRHILSAGPVTQRRLDFEHARPTWLRDMFAEATGVFFYVYPGMAATAAFILQKENSAFGSIFTIGLAYGVGAALGIICCAGTSGGHLNPSITICFAIWQGFPWRKVPYYIFAQIAGAFFAGLILYGQYYQQIEVYRLELEKLGMPEIFAGSPASIFTSYPLGSQTHQGWLVLIEFFVDAFIGFAIWAVLDPSNPFISASIAPFFIGLAYCLMIWGFASVTISTNLARDLGGRLVAMLFFGSEAFTYMSYWWIGIFINIPATIFATCFYELVFRDSLDKIALGHAQHEDGMDGIARHLSQTGLMDPYPEERILRRKEYGSQSSRIS